LHNVFRQDIGHRAGRRLGHRGFESSRVGITHNIQQPRTTGGNVVGQQIDAIEAGHRQDRVPFPLLAVTGVLFVNGQQLSPQHFGQEVTVPARRFEEARIDPLALMGDEVEHVVDQFGRSEHLAVVDDALTRVRHGWGHDLLVLFAKFRQTWLRALNISQKLAPSAARPGVVMAYFMD
jgi:hypothetical protein